MKPCPDEEGIKTLEGMGFAVKKDLKPCPDEEGIKTLEGFQHVGIFDYLKPCPDEEGIKTSLRAAKGPVIRSFETLP